MNDTKIIDAMHGRIAAVDVTHQLKFNKLLALVTSIRTSLHSNSSLRAPYVELLCSLYKKKSGLIRKIKNLRPNIPTDEDICQYFENCWPDVTIATPLDEDPKSAFIWGFTYVGVEAADDNAVYINGSLVNHWLMMNTETPGISVHKVSLLITSTIFHELAHRLLVWWSMGYCRTPNIQPVSKEGGNFLERRMFGGPVVGWWAEESVGDFKNLSEIGVTTRFGTRFFDDTVTSDCLHRLTQPDIQLPLIQPLSLPRSNPSHLVRAKLTSCDPWERKLHGRRASAAQLKCAPRQKGVTTTAEGTGLGLGLGLSCTVLFKNDTLPYPCT